MKKVLGRMAGILFAAFTVAVFGFAMSFTWAALGRLFPGSFVNQIWGMILFDVSAICWALAFVFLARSVAQYAVAGIGFLAGFLGTILMISAEVFLGGQSFVADNNMGMWMVYGFIFVALVHVGLIYAFHAADPETHAKINVGIARGEIETEAIRQATQTLDEGKSEYARTIQGRIVSDSLRDLNIPYRVDPQIGFVEVPPAEVKASAANPDKSSSWQFWKRNKTVPPPVALEQIVKAEGLAVPKVEPVQTNKKQEDADPGDAPFPGADSE